MLIPRRHTMKIRAEHGTSIRRSWAAVLMLLWTACAGAATVVVYPLTGAGIDSRYDYDWAVLRTALLKTVAHYGAFELRQSQTTMSSQRVTQELANQPGRINIFVRATDPDLEQQFLPIRLPVDRGLLGYRVFLVREADLPRFAAVRNLDDLRRFRAGQGKGWADVDILKAAQLNVLEGSTYDGLFAMLEAKRFDFFSRAADEATREYDERHTSNPTMAVESTLLLHYPLPRYFFAARRRRQTAGRTHHGRHGNDDTRRLAQRTFLPLQRRHHRARQPETAPPADDRQSQPVAGNAAVAQRVVVRPAAR